MKKTFLLIVITALAVLFVVSAFYFFIIPAGEMPPPPETAKKGPSSSNTSESPIEIVDTPDYSINPGETVCVKVDIHDRSILPENLVPACEQLSSFNYERVETDTGVLFNLTPKEAGDYTVWIETSDGRIRTENVFIIAGDLSKMYPKQEEQDESKPSNGSLIHSFSGTGDDVTSTISINYPSRIAYTHTGDGYFSVKGYYGNSEYDYDLIANDIGDVSGESLLLPGKYEFEVKSESFWSLKIYTLGSREIDSFRGDTSSVSDVFTPSTKIYNIKYSGDGYFSVKIYYGTGEHDYDLLVNTIGDYEGTVRCSKLYDTAVWKVEADGAWEILPVR